MNIFIVMRGWAVAVTFENYNRFIVRLTGVERAKDVQCSSDSSR